MKITAQFHSADEYCYIPQNCQVHTCDSPAVMYCATMYVFVCRKHFEEFCVKEGHKVESIEEGLRECIRQTESTISGTESHLAKLRVDLERYKQRLTQLVPRCRCRPPAVYQGANTECCNLPSGHEGPHRNGDTEWFGGMENPLDTPSK